MEKQKRWQFVLIIAVILLTVYNILPTIFYYSKPLSAPIDASRANKIAMTIAERTNSLEEQSVEWLGSFCDLLSLKPASIVLDPAHPQFVSVNFKNTKDAERFRSYLPRAGSIIPFVPAQLSVYQRPNENSEKNVVVQRKIPLHINPADLSAFYEFSPKFDEKGLPTDLYRSLVNDRALQIGFALSGTSENAQYLNAIAANPSSQQSQDLTLFLSQNILSFTRVFGENSSISKRYFSSFTQSEISNREDRVQSFLSAISTLKDKVKLERIALQEEEKQLKTEGGFLETLKQQQLATLLSKEKTLTSAEALVKKQAQAFASGSSPWNYITLGAALQESAMKVTPATQLQVISLNNHNPFIDQLIIDWNSEKIYLHLYPDLVAFKDQLAQGKTNIYLKDLADQLIYNEIATLSRESGEDISPLQDQFEISLNQLNGSRSFLAMRLGKIAEVEAKQVQEAILTTWNPTHLDLKREHFPVSDYQAFMNLPAGEQKLGLVIYAPATTGKIPAKGFRMNSIYVIAKGVNKILEKFRAHPDSEEAKLFLKDFDNLRTLLQQNGFFGYAGTTYPLSSEYANDFIFEAEDYFQTLLKASREDFTVHGTKRYAVLEFSNVEQRILTENKIGTRIHEDLLKWRDDYRAAMVNIYGNTKYDVPAPTQNVYWDNFKLSFVKYFRGDDRKILHWGLDLSGGKTVQIELRDQNNRPVTDEMDIKQGINELYNRVNKMGVSEVSIRQEGDYITLDFPGSQELSASELVKASSMYFHVVNEQFSPQSPTLGDSANRFLQEVWNEAVVTNRKDPESINLIAWKHLYGDSLDSEAVQPRSEAARVLYENGLRFARPEETATSSAFNDVNSKIAVLRGEDFAQWHGQSHPLMIVFRNYALEGSNLENVHASYDPSKGNFLSFGVQRSQTTSQGEKISPSDDLFVWTSEFSKEKIVGTPNETYSRGHGWRMAVILNGTVISAPTLDSPLRDSAMITGSFSQREINQLESDLKAGSLTFTPHILSEKNVSPELGSHERMLGILATIIALILVMVAMIGYYRFGGLVATVAVIFNLLIMWATLQNLHATLTLAGLAGMILTLGMAVDANVLVFERIREEFAVTGRIASAVHAGYRKAFSAIVDSNITTIIAAFILLHFDSGPIKGFAVTLIIGIISSMFTALFMTRYFFAGWVQNPEHKSLKMMNFIQGAKFNFLKHTKLTIWLSTIIIVLGALVATAQRSSLLGMDFTGGFALTLEVQPTPNVDYRAEVEKALVKAGATPQEFQIRELTPSNNIRLFLSRNLEEKGRPFYGMPIENAVSNIGYPYEANPKISWVVQSLKASGISLSQQSLEHLDRNWVDVSGQMSSTMRNSAIIGLCLALVCILIYITARFEFKYAISATICLAHDVIFSVAMVAILHALGVPVQIDLNTVAALMTIIGYSLNDTIIVFDRIREDVRHMRKSSLGEIINHSLNITLSRTVMTSGTTMLVLIPLVALGGSTIFGFALVMIIGVVFGTLSSLFIAAPLMQYFHNKQLQREARSLSKQIT